MDPKACQACFHGEIRKILLARYFVEVKVAISNFWLAHMDPQISEQGHVSQAIG